MNKFKINPELNEALLISMEQQGDFLADLQLTFALQNYTVIASKQLFFVTIKGKNVLPIFTTEEDYRNASEKIKFEQIEFTERKFSEVLEEAMGTEIDFFGFNLDPDFLENSKNHAYFDKMLMMNFMTYYTMILNSMFNPENPNLEITEKFMLSPAVNSGEEGKTRSFLNLTSPDGSEYIPVFDNMDSFQKWYRTDYFAEPFKEVGGNVQLVRIEDLLIENEGEDHLTSTAGITLNPLDYQTEDYEKSLYTWDKF